MRAYGFKAAVDEIRKSGGSRQTLYIREAWRDRCMTIFGYMDGSAEVFENSRAYMAFNSVAEAIVTVKRIQSDYDKAVEADRHRYANRATKVESYTIEEWYRYSPRGTYFGD